MIIFIFLKKGRMSSSSNDEVYEVFEEMVDQQIDDFIDSVLTKEPKRRAYIEEIGNKDTINYGRITSVKILHTHTTCLGGVFE